MILLLKNTQPQTFLCENINAKWLFKVNINNSLSKFEQLIKGILKFVFVTFMFL
jgi:hypothetical protein